MGINSLKLKLLSVFVAFVLVFGIMPVAPVHAATTVAASNTSSLETFIASLSKADSSKLIGVFIKNILAVPVVQQSSTYSVSSKAGTVTQFGLASQSGSIGLLAHNYLSGSKFSKLQSGTEIFLVYGDGSTKKFTVSNTKKYQTLKPTDPFSDFINLDNPDTILSSSSVFDTIYGSGGNLIFQTCIRKNGNSSWGIMFVTASPAN